MNLPSRDEILSMEGGEQMACLLAEHVMGWKYMLAEPWGSVDDALMVADTLDLPLYLGQTQDKKSWYAYFLGAYDNIASLYGGTAYAQTPALAICRAALLVVEARQ